VRQTFQPPKTTVIPHENLYVSFAECSLFYRALLQKRPIILRSLLIEARHLDRHTPTIVFDGVEVRARGRGRKRGSQGEKEKERERVSESERK